MLRLLPHVTRDCEGVHRRDFLQIGTLAGLGLSLPTLLAGRRAAANVPATKEVNCILIWTQGGTSHHDTFDPKPDAPVSVRGSYQVVDTAVPGIKFTEIVPRMAKELNRFAILRGWNPQNAGHGVAEQYMMSGHNINPAVVHPCYGSIIAHQKGFKTRMPPFIQIGGAVDHATFGGGTAGYLGAEYNPFELLANPNTTPFNVRDITPPAGVDLTRIERRRSMLGAIDALQRKIDVSQTGSGVQAALTQGEREIAPAAFDALDEHYRAALNMITAPETKKAFDIDSEDAGLRDRYGRTVFGQSCLLARRLIESGVRFVTVSDGGWDHHADLFNGMKNKLPPLDQAIPELLIDLEQRGLLETTLVVWLTDFGRTPKINSASGRDHWASAGFIMMAGAGVPGGSILGKTDDEGGRPTDHEYFTEDVAATIYTKLGIPLDLITMTPDGRPIRLNEGRVIKEWM
ncbi:MAG TPA: DUF1501 domain-containing protein [Pirellulales bacterium]|nr:DUF1501 domain-containing protein [Pirellulales bacterium]